MKTIDHYIQYYNLDTQSIDYTNSFVNKKVKKIWIDNMFCTIHNHTFSKPISKIAEGSLCPKCGIERSKQKRTQFNFEEKAHKIHGDTYDYSLVQYVNNTVKVKIKCKNGHIFEQRPNDHLKGNGCLYCYDQFNTNFNYIDRCKSKKRTVTNLYLIKVYNETESFLKVGITVDMDKRFYKFPYNYEVIKLISGEIEFIFNMEQKIHKHFKNDIYKPFIYFSGISECYPLSLLNDIQQVLDNTQI